MKKIRENIEFKTQGGIFDLFDNAIKGAYNITDAEYDYIAEHMTDDEMSAFLSGCGMGPSDEIVTFSMIREGLTIRNKYISQMNR
jgi:hypothetical protein